MDEEYIVERMPYDVLEKTVRKLKEAYDELAEKVNQTPSGGGINDIVVPDKNTTERGSAGLVYMYNESSGLRLDADKRLCIAAANDTDIKTAANDKTKASVNKPIVPYYMQAALQAFLPKVTNTNMDIGGEKEMLPPATYAVREYLQNKALGARVKFAKIPPGGKFIIKPNVIALVLPYDGTASFRKNGQTEAVISNLGSFALVFATDRVDGNDELNETGTSHWISVTYASTLSVKNNHTRYKLNSADGNSGAYFNNGHGTGNMYVYYLSS